MSRLTELGIKWGTDKVGHGFLPIYEKHLPEKIERFIEIGTWHGAGIQMFKEYYNHEGAFYVLDIFGGEVISQVELQRLGIHSFAGSQSDPAVISHIKEIFDVITEDGSHHSDEQIITFKHFFINNLKNGGVYFMEDVHCCTDKYWWRGIIHKFEDTALHIFKQAMNGGNLISQFVSPAENEQLMGLIDNIENYNDSMLIIKKK